VNKPASESQEERPEVISITAPPFKNRAVSRARDARRAPAVRGGRLRGAGERGKPRLRPNGWPRSLSRMRKDGGFRVVTVVDVGGCGVGGEDFSW